MGRNPSDVTTCRCRVAAALLCLAGPAVGADVLYKWIGPDGVIAFSNVPSDKSRDGEHLQIPDSALPGAGPRTGQDPLHEERSRAVDVVQRASEQVDIAERALAVARRAFWTMPDPGHLNVSRMARIDRDRIEFCKRNFIEARQLLLEVLRQARSVTVREEPTVRKEPAAREELAAIYEVPIPRP